MRDIVPIGPPGSGKSTQGKLIAAKFGLGYVSTGQLFRDEAAKQTEAGRRIGRSLAAGELLPDEETYPLVRAALLAPPGALGLVIDGFPRTDEQAVEFERIVGAPEEQPGNEPEAGTQFAAFRIPRSRIELPPGET